MNGNETFAKKQILPKQSLRQFVSNKHILGLTKVIRYQAKKKNRRQN